MKDGRFIRFYESQCRSNPQYRDSDIEALCKRIDDLLDREFQRGFEAGMRAATQAGKN